MEGKVILYDSNDIKIGETFIRRARQLVKQQRASWVDDSQDAIRFAPGMDKMDDAVVDDMRDKYSLGIDEELMKLAKRRVYARFAFKLHSSIAIVLSALVIIIYLLTDSGGYFWPVWPMLSLGLSVAIHGLVYKIINGEDMEYKITREYERLKHKHSYLDYENRRS